MKIGFLIDSASRRSGGLYDANRFLVQALARENNKIYLYSVRDEDTEKDLGGWGNVQAFVADPVGPRRFGYSPALKHLLLQNSPDILHSQGLWIYSSAVSLKWRATTNKPLVIHPHGMLDPWALRNSNVKKKLTGALFEWRHLRLSSCIRALCVSEAQSVRALGVRVPIAIIPNGITFSTGSREATEASVHSDSTGARLNKTNNKPKQLLYLGRIHPKKGLENLVKAWSYLHKDRSTATQDWKLVIAGWGEGGHEAFLQRLATYLDLEWHDPRVANSCSTKESTIDFIGPQFGDDKEKCFRNCDAFILPSFSEGLPMVVLEAWSYAKPVLMTPQCNLPEGFRANAAIELHADAKSIYQTLIDFMRLSDCTRIGIGQSGRKLVEEKFTWPEVASSVHAVSRWLVYGDPMPSCVVTD